jgi:hypothetical protein
MISSRSKLSSTAQLAMKRQGGAHGGFLFEVKVPHAKESFKSVHHGFGAEAVGAT